MLGPVSVALCVKGSVVERIPQPDPELTIFGLSHAASVLAITILVLAVYILVDMIRPGKRARSRNAAETEGDFDWSEDRGDRR